MTLYGAKHIRAGTRQIHSHMLNTLLNTLSCTHLRLRLPSVSLISVIRCAQLINIGCFLLVLRRSPLSRLLHGFAIQRMFVFKFFSTVKLRAVTNLLGP